MKSLQIVQLTCQFFKKIKGGRFWGTRGECRIVSYRVVLLSDVIVSLI